MKNLIHPFFVFTVALVMSAAFLLSYYAKHGIGGLDASFTRVPLNLFWGLVGLVAMHTISVVGLESLANRVKSRIRQRDR